MCITFLRIYSNEELDCIKPSGSLPRIAIMRTVMVGNPQAHILDRSTSTSHIKRRIRCCPHICFSEMHNAAIDDSRLCDDISREQELARTKRILLYVCFIDLTKAYDCVDRNPPLKSTRPFWRATKYDLGHSSVPRWYASMRTARRQDVLGVVHCGIGPSSRVSARTPPVQHLLRGPSRVSRRTKIS